MEILKVIPRMPHKGERPFERANITPPYKNKAKATIRPALAGKPINLKMNGMKKKEAIPPKTPNCIFLTKDFLIFGSMIP